MSINKQLLAIVLSLGIGATACTNQVARKPTTLYGAHSAQTAQRTFLERATPTHLAYGDGEVLPK
jgi:hypothetical protein